MNSRFPSQGQLSQVDWRRGAALWQCLSGWSALSAPDALPGKINNKNLRLSLGHIKGGKHGHRAISFTASIPAACTRLLICAAAITSCIESRREPGPRPPTGCLDHSERGRLNRFTQISRLARRMTDPALKPASRHCVKAIFWLCGSSTAWGAAFITWSKPSACCPSVGLASRFSLGKGRRLTRQLRQDGFHSASLPLSPNSKQN